MQSYPQRMFQVKRKSLKCTRPRLEKMLCWDSKRVPRGVETCAKPLHHPATLKKMQFLWLFPFNDRSLDRTYKSHMFLIPDSLMQKRSVHLLNMRNFDSCDVICGTGISN